MILTRGKFIVLYGNNNTGKSTQLDLLEQRLIKKKIEYKRIKYPIYNLPPTGPLIYDVLRGKKEIIDEDKFQILAAQNRRDYEKELKLLLDRGVLVLAEDYAGTGIAWGVVHGVSLERMEEINKGLLTPDAELFLDGPRRIGALEKGHINEDGGNWELAREVHLRLASRYGWKIIDGDGSVEEVEKRIWEVIEPILGVERGGK